MTFDTSTEQVALRWLGGGRRCAQALLVGVEGSAPLPVGSMMLVSLSGEIEGSLTGGCVEGAVVGEAERLLAGPAEPRLLVYGITDELAGTAGLACGGIVNVFVSELAGEDAEVERAVLAAHIDDRPAAIATLLGGPQAGARLAIVDGEVRGSLRGVPVLDRDVARELSAFLEDGASDFSRYRATNVTLEDGLQLHFRAYAPPPRMVIIGANGFSAALAPIAGRVGYRVEVWDARARFLESQQFTDHATVRVGWPQELMQGQELSSRDAILVFTHDPKFDEPALIAALGTEAGYIGALGSRRTTADRSERLRGRGVSDAELDRIHAPCGLDIGGRMPEETAISVVAEIIALRSNRPGRPLATTSGSIHTGGDSDECGLYSQGGPPPQSLVPRSTLPESSRHAHH